MRQSNLFSRTRKDVGADEQALNARLLIKAGFVYKVMAGVYAYTPLGLIVIEKIKQIVRQEMNSIQAQEILMSSLQKKTTWEKTDRWDDTKVDVWFKTFLKDNTEIGLGWSHEEAVIEMISQYLKSYRDLSINVYQFQTKMRNELRAKSGLLRGREFIMKDMYSCSLDDKQHEAFYQNTIKAYNRIFDRLGIGDKTYMTFASGGAFTEFSHEFQTICDAGEDYIYLDKTTNQAINEEIYSDESLQQLGINKSNLEKVKTAEVGNIFNFKTHKSEQMNFKFAGEDGKEKYVHLGSYGIGVTRLMGVIAESFADEKGLIWPEAVAPFQVYLIAINNDCAEIADELYDKLLKNGIEVFYDDRHNISPGVKFVDSDLMGMPYRLVVSPKLLAKQAFELANRKTSELEIVTEEELIKKFKGEK